MPILDELKKKANGKADGANNIAEAIAQMDFSEGSVTPEEIAESVSAYLDEHLTNPTNPPLDTSLTIANAAADSKATGDKLSELKEDLADFENTILVDGNIISLSNATLMHTVGDATISFDGAERSGLAVRAYRNCLYPVHVTVVNHNRKDDEEFLS